MSEGINVPGLAGNVEALVARWFCCPAVWANDLSAGVTVSRCD